MSGIEYLDPCDRAFITETNPPARRKDAEIFKLLDLLDNLQSANNLSEEEAP